MNLSLVKTLLVSNFFFRVLYLLLFSGTLRAKHFCLFEIFEFVNCSYTLQEMSKFVKTNQELEVMYLFLEFLSYFIILAAPNVSLIQSVQILQATVFVLFRNFEVL